MAALKNITRLGEELLANPVARANSVDSLLAAIVPTGDQQSALVALRALEIYFSDALQKYELPPAKKQQAETDAAPEVVYARWLAVHLKSYQEKLLDVLCAQAPAALQVSALAASMELTSAGARRFDSSFFKQLMQVLLRSGALHDSVLGLFEARFLQHVNVRYYVLHAISKNSVDRTVPGAIGTEAQTRRMLRMLEGAPAAAQSETEPPAKRRRLPAEPKWASVVAQRQAFSRAWLAFLARDLPPDVLADVLERMHEEVLPHVTNPLLLAEFLTGALDAGGLNGMLALHGIFRLVTRHGLEYPAFYARLYSLLRPDIFLTKHRVRIIELTDTFLSSALVPAYTAAAFAKKFARLALTAPPAGSFRSVCEAVLTTLS